MISHKLISAFAVLPNANIDDRVIYNYIVMGIMKRRSPERYILMVRHTFSYLILTTTGGSAESSVPGERHGSIIISRDADLSHYS